MVPALSRFINRLYGNGKTAFIHACAARIASGAELGRTPSDGVSAVTPKRDIGAQFVKHNRKPGVPDSREPF
jgi:hypothetical protein